MDKKLPLPTPGKEYWDLIADFPNPPVPDPGPQYVFGVDPFYKEGKTGKFTVYKIMDDRRSSER